MQMLAYVDNIWNMNDVFTSLFTPSGIINYGSLVYFNLLIWESQNEPYSHNFSQTITFVLLEIALKTKHPRVHEIFICLLMNTNCASLLILIHSLAHPQVVCWFNSYVKTENEKGKDTQEEKCLYKKKHGKNTCSYRWTSEHVTILGCMYGE